MKIAFCSNYLNHHQLYLSKAIINAGIEYYFIAAEQMEKERKNGGWINMNDKYDWVVRIYQGQEQIDFAKRIINNADLVIMGSFPIKFIRQRIFKNKPVFLYSERWFKSSDGDNKKFKTFHKFLSNLIHIKYLNFFNVYMLCASAYTAYDCNLFGNFKNKCYKWGYFPYVKTYDLNKLMEIKKENDIVELLWVARMLDWKHPEYVVHLAKRLKKKGIKFHINMIGTGDKFEEIKASIISENLLPELNLIESIPNESVREYMEKANIFLFTSDFNEGWGVVLNEAMNSGCAVVACNGIGAVPFLVEDRKNGLIYNNGDIDEFCNMVETLICNKELCEELGRNAYETIISEWNPENAVRKLLKLYNILCKKSNETIEYGICSKAEILDQNYRK